MKFKVIASLLVLSMLLSLAGCNFPLTRENRQSAAPSAIPGSEGVSAAAEPVGDFDPLDIDCLVGTWEVDGASMVYAGNMLIGGASGLTLTRIPRRQISQIAEFGLFTHYW